jgi:hypothetical protein
MKHRSSLALALVFVAAAACGKSKDSTPAQGGDDEDLMYDVKDATQDINKLEAGIASPTPYAEAVGICVTAIADAKPLAKKHPELAKKLETLCWHDVPVAEINAELAAVAALPAGASNDSLCHKSLYQRALQDLASHHAEDDVSKDAVAHHDRVCSSK